MRPFTFHASQIIFCWEGDTLSWAEVTEALERWSVGTTTSLASMTALPHHSWWHTEVSLVGGHSVTWSSCWLHWELGQYQMLFKQSVWNVTQIYCNIKKRKKERLQNKAIVENTIPLSIPCSLKGHTESLKHTSAMICLVLLLSAYWPHLPSSVGQTPAPPELSANFRIVVTFLKYKNRRGSSQILIPGISYRTQEVLNSLISTA